MFASQSQDLMIAEDGQSYPWEALNAGARVAEAFLRFAETVIADNLHARRHGLTIVNAYSNPDGREGDGSTKVKTYPTDLIVPEVFEAASKVKTLARLGARAHADDMPKIEAAQRAALAALGTLDTDLWSAWVASEKAHMPGPEAAILEVEGFAWTTSHKGHCTEIRYRDDAQSYTRQGKHYTRDMTPTAYVSEDDMIDSLTEGW